MDQTKNNVCVYQFVITNKIQRLGHPITDNKSNTVRDRR